MLFILGWLSDVITVEEVIYMGHPNLTPAGAAVFPSIFFPHPMGWLLLETISAAISTVALLNTPARFFQRILP